MGETGVDIQVCLIPGCCLENKLKMSASKKRFETKNREELHQSLLLDLSNNKTQSVLLSFRFPLRTECLAPQKKPFGGDRVLICSAINVFFCEADSTSGQGFCCF